MTIAATPDDVTSLRKRRFKTRDVGTYLETLTQFLITTLS